MRWVLGWRGLVVGCSRDLWCYAMMHDLLEWEARAVSPQGSGFSESRPTGLRGVVGGQFSVEAGLDAVFGLPEDGVLSWSLACVEDWGVMADVLLEAGLGLQLVTLCRGPP